MAKVKFLKQAMSFVSGSYILNFMIIQIRKPENKGFYLGSNKKNNSGKEMNKIEGRFPKSK